MFNGACQSFIIIRIWICSLEAGQQAKSLDWVWWDPYRQLMRSKKHSLQIFKSKFNVVTWCTPCLISFNYGYMVWVKFSNLNIHIAQCTPTSHLSEGGDIEVISSVHRLINEGTDFTNTVTMCVRCDFKLQCAQVVKCPINLMKAVVDSREL